MALLPSRPILPSPLRLRNGRRGPCRPLRQAEFSGHQHPRLWEVLTPGIVVLEEPAALIAGEPGAECTFVGPGQVHPEPVIPLHELPVNGFGQARVEEVAEPSFLTALVRRGWAGRSRRTSGSSCPDGRDRAGLGQAPVAEVDKVLTRSLPCEHDG